ncbi:Eco57I restriction-modification methylase domain-containing protein [Actinomadura formosensis]|uniref:Eco57I restriction-modification methylase domain-containing protein n=1 Tax=Actinomadura formosensis TaxID=60706 RepID=UPI003D8AA387
MPPRTRRPVQTVAEQHAEWLGLLRPDGPFLALPVLVEALPQGLETVPAETRDEIRQAWNQVQDDPDLLLPGWYDRVLRVLLGIPFNALVQGSTIEELYRRARPDLVAYGPSPAGRAMRLFIYKHPWDEHLTRGHGDRPSPVEQAAALCRETGVPLALVTNGRFWILVHARHGEATSTAAFDADLWLEEPVLLRAFATLLGARRSLAPAERPDGTPSDGLASLFARSAQAQAQVTDTLGRQVRQAVELLVGELARLDRESGGALLADVAERDIYRAALIVLMRLVFLLYAEEQELLPTDELYRLSYGVAALYDRLSKERDQHGEEVGDRRSAAWYRLLALFRAVHGGSEHPDLRIPAYGGSLFDPSGFEWLASAPVTDRVVQEVLDALLILRHKRGKAAAERLSYKGLDVEQIGHVYEGLLEFSCLKVDEPYVGLMGRNEPELPLRRLEEEYAKGAASFLAWLKDTCGATSRQLEKVLAKAPDSDQAAALHAACDNDEELAARIRPFSGLLRPDLRGDPTVYPAKSVLFTQVGDRRATGTHYTPKSLAQEIVQHTLAPLCHRPGPAEGAPEDEWRVKPAAELLELKVCDPAMGSGAFLVSACRYIAERVVDAWERDGVPGDVLGLLGPDHDRDDLLVFAKRRVAASCMYGVDRDDMAVELAKLSMWIETLAKDKPFSFLDHALRHGDSLVGLIDEAQVKSFHLDPKRGSWDNARLGNVMDDLVPLLTRAQELREEIEAFPADDIERVAEKRRKLAEAERLTESLRLAADTVTAAALSTAGRPEDVLDARLRDLADEVRTVLRGEGTEWTKDTAREAVTSPLEEQLRGKLESWLKGTRKTPVKPFHWSLEFPEVMRRGGFSAVVGNPPFIGGQRLTGAMGTDMREYLVQHIGGGRRGSADLCAYFYLRDLAITNNGRVGIIATNTLAQGDTREVGLAQARDKGWDIYRAEKSQPWPGTASLEVSLVWTGHPQAEEKPILDGREVIGITSSLDRQSLVVGDPYRLAANAGKSFQGSIVLGMGFILSPEQAQELIEKNPRNKDVLFPYMSGEDLNSRWDLSAPRWVINFHDWDEGKARIYADCFEIVEREVKPFRATNNRKARRERWWQFAERAAGLYAATEGLDRVIVIAQTSRTQMPVLVSTGQVLSHMLTAIATSDFDRLAFHSSEFQFLWTARYSAGLKADLRFFPSDCFDNLPQPPQSARLNSVGKELDSFRSAVMRRRQLGLTALYNLMHDARLEDEDSLRLRNIHREIDDATLEAYALDEGREPAIQEFETRVASKELPPWREIELEHGFHQTPQGVRFTISPQARDIVLDKLLALNHYRYRQEVEQGLHGKKRGRKKVSATGGKSQGTAVDASVESEEASPEESSFDGLFAPPDALF